MQRRLIIKFKGVYKSPFDLQKMGQLIENGYLTECRMPTAKHMRVAVGAITEGQFNHITNLLGDLKQDICAFGRRISDTVRTYLPSHLIQTSIGVFHNPLDPESWSEYLLRMKPRYILFLADFQRYQPNLAKLAKKANTERKAQVIPIRDKWLSSANRYASEVLAVSIDNGTTWDSYSAALAITESHVTRVAKDNWDNKNIRIETSVSVRQNSTEVG